MKINLENVRLLKIKKYLKELPLFFIFAGSSFNYKNWVEIEQKIKKKFKFYKIFNKSTNKVFNKSIFLNKKNIAKGMVFFFSANTNIKIKKKDLNQDMFFCMAVKLNTKMYNVGQLNTLNTINYKNVCLGFSSCCLAKLKKPFSG